MMEHDKLRFSYNHSPLKKHQPIIISITPSMIARIHKGKMADINAPAANERMIIPMALRLPHIMRMPPFHVIVYSGVL